MYKVDNLFPYEVTELSPEEKEETYGMGRAHETKGQAMKVSFRLKRSYYIFTKPNKEKVIQMEEEEKEYRYNYPEDFL